MRLSEMIEKAIEIKNRVGDLNVEQAGMPAALYIVEKETEQLVVEIKPDE